MSTGPTSARPMLTSRWSSAATAARVELGFFGMALLAAMTLGCASTAPSNPKPVLLNGEYIARAPSAAASLWDIDHAAPLALDVDAAAQGVVLDDPATVVRHVLRACPPVAVVRPTEGYYYFRFRCGHAIISGNLRFTDAALGVLHTGYFDENDADARVWAASFGPGDPRVEVSSPTPRTYDIAMGSDVRVRFRVPSPSRTLPPDLAPGERFISRVLDESGFALILLWSDAHDAFFFSLDEDAPLPDVLAPIERLPAPLGARGSVEIGLRSGFVFWRPTGATRRVLVGVRADSVRRNNYFDGPFDQVPPDLPLKPLLERAYPYVSLRGGIDQHGNFNLLESQRVAISPYVQYPSTSGLIAELTRRIEATPNDDRLSTIAALTYEPKREFDPAAPRPFSDFVNPEAARLADPSPAWITRGWPANHAGTVSREWPPSHHPDTSQSWPPDHEATTSARPVLVPNGAP